MAYLDLAELPSVQQRCALLGSRRASLVSFRRQDHLGDDWRPLDHSVRALCRQTSGHWPLGPIRLLTQLRCLGWYFSPLNLYYVFDDAGQRVEAIVAEVSNTPWNERHQYVLWEGNRVELTPKVRRYSLPKTFHVSPFMNMALSYQWAIREPSESLSVRLQACRDNQVEFQARMALRRRPLSDWALLGMLLRRPVPAIGILSGIYFEALRLWLKKAPFYPHPQRSPASLDTASTANPSSNPTRLVP